MADLRREVERLKKEEVAWRKFTKEANATVDKAEQEIAALKAKLSEAENNLNDIRKRDDERRGA